MHNKLLLLSFSEFSYHLSQNDKINGFLLFWESFERTEVDFTNMFTQSLYVCRSQKRKKTVKPSVFICALGIWACKSLVETCW